MGIRLEIDMPEHHYNNIMAFDSVILGRVPYKGIIMYAINAIKHGKVLEQEATIQERQAEIDRIDAAFQAGYKNGYAQARFDYEQEPILDKIRAEIAEIHLIGYATVDGKREIASRAVMQIIDKYKAGSEVKDGSEYNHHASNT